MAELEEIVREYQKKTRAEKIELLKLELPRKHMISLLIEFQQPTKQRRLSAKTLALLVTHFERNWKKVDEFFDEIEKLKIPIDRWCELRSEAEKMTAAERKKWQKAFDETADLRSEVLSRVSELVPRVRASIVGYDATLSQDMDSIGYLGLIKAMENFDPERGVPFDVYSKSWIYNSMVQFIRKDKLVNPSEKVLRCFRLYDKTFTRLQTELGREPDELEIAEAMDMSTEELQNLLEIDTSTTSFDQPATREDDYTLHEVLGEDQAAPYDEMEGKILARNLQEHMKSLEGVELSVALLRWHPLNQCKLQGQPMPIDQAISRMQEISLNQILKNSVNGQQFASKMAGALS